MTEFLEADVEILDRHDVEVTPSGPLTKQTDKQQAIQGIAILGSHPQNVLDAPYHEPWLIYSCSPHNVEHRRLPRVDQWFEVHNPIEDPTRAFGYLTAVSKMPFVWMTDKRALASGLFKGGRYYDVDKIRGTARRDVVSVPTGMFERVMGPDGKPRFVDLLKKKSCEVSNRDGIFDYNMFTSSIAYMLAKAILDCEKHRIPNIGLWGIMQASDTEYTYQRPGIQYFMNQAMDRGINVMAPRESCLYDAPTWKW